MRSQRNERELRACIRQAAALMRDIQEDSNNAVESGLVSRMTEHTERQLAAWFALPVVQSALALEAADEKER